MKKGNHFISIQHNNAKQHEDYSFLSSEWVQRALGNRKYLPFLTARNHFSTQAVTTSGGRNDSELN